MTRDVIELTIPDLSHFAKALRSSLEGSPSHAEMLGHIARAAGYRNYQHLRARHEPQPQADLRRVERALRLFDDAGLMLRWPGKHSLQGLCLWAVWAQLPPREAMTERQISQRIDTLTAFRDAAQIRRGLIEHRLASRNIDGSAYHRVEQGPSPEARLVIRAVLARRKSGQN
ncbi:DUF2087 domain-containing protein [Pseudoprimorskyibacter insulae]|uniref:DUF2087 domain-containing protein n=1 Tax=Pseudoprimorskyibacter insulae TaxID=1695997 RepID=A0A2R8AY01_9RHOB|nr:DUF2087 domain-containing protein [Pseudoprimorskyibacter insulae]SPF80739.1 hypothetical protein PRI8871_02550 [Pseudoprimorskyibacter insulae]